MAQVDFSMTGQIACDVKLISERAAAVGFRVEFLAITMGANKQ